MDSFILWLEAHPAMAGWIQALGAIAALIVTASIVGIEGSRSRRSLERQAALHNQQVAFQADQERAVRARQRAAAVNKMAAAVEFYQRAVVALIQRDEVAPLVSVYQHDFDIGQSLIATLPYEEAADEEEVRRWSSLLSKMGDARLSISRLADRESPESLALNRALLKEVVRSMRECVTRSGGGMGETPEALMMTDADSEALR